MSRQPIPEQNLTDILKVFLCVSNNSPAINFVTLLVHHQENKLPIALSRKDTRNLNIEPLLSAFNIPLLTNPIPRQELPLHHDIPTTRLRFEDFPRLIPLAVEQARRRYPILRDKVTHFEGMFLLTLLEHMNCEYEGGVFETIDFAFRTACEGVISPLEVPDSGNRRIEFYDFLCNDVPPLASQYLGLSVFGVSGEEDFRWSDVRLKKHWIDALSQLALSKRLKQDTETLDRLWHYGSECSACDPQDILDQANVADEIEDLTRVVTYHRKKLFPLNEIGNVFARFLELAEHHTSETDLSVLDSLPAITVSPSPENVFAAWEHARNSLVPELKNSDPEFFLENKPQALPKNLEPLQGSTLQRIRDALKRNSVESWSGISLRLLKDADTLDRVAVLIGKDEIIASFFDLDFQNKNQKLDPNKPKPKKNWEYLCLILRTGSISIAEINPQYKGIDDKTISEPVFRKDMRVKRESNSAEWNRFKKQVGFINSDLSRAFRIDSDAIVFEHPENDPLGSYRPQFHVML